MGGINLFNNSNNFSESKYSTCIFISHKNEDKRIARKVAQIIKEMKINIYFDEDDRTLQIANQNQNDEAIVNCIEEGLNHSTHLLGIITSKTKGSWWLPYGVGGATGRKNPCAHIVTGDVSELPSYITISTLIKDSDELMRWINKNCLRTIEFMQENLSPLSLRNLREILPQKRSSPIKYI